jgi:hypothetical protein
MSVDTVRQDVVDKSKKQSGDNGDEQVQAVRLLLLVPGIIDPQNVPTLTPALSRKGRGSRSRLQQRPFSPCGRRTG